MSAMAYYTRLNPATTSFHVSVVFVGHSADAVPKYP